MRSSYIWTGLLFLSASALAASKSLPITRWSQQAADCSFQQADDGRTYYGISSGDFEVVLAVDSKELEKISHRATPMLSVLLSFHYRGSGQLAINRKDLVLEFVKHSHVIKDSLPPDDLLKQLRQDVDDLSAKVARHGVPTHSEENSQKEVELQTRLQDYTEMMDFISTRALRSTVLNPMNSSASGWVFFPVQDRWIGPWRRPEQFLLRIPLERMTFEFPFSLPPERDKIELRRRHN